MSKLGEIVYMINDEIKLFSDDSSFTEDHIIYLVSKYRAAILKQEYSNIKKEVAVSNYTEICVSLETTDILEGFPCDGQILKSKEPIPNTISIGTVKVYPRKSFMHEHIIYITPERIKFTGYNKYLKSFIYATIGYDGHLYLRSANPQMLYLESVSMSAVFADLLTAQEYSCAEGEEACKDWHEIEFDLEDNLIPLVIQSVLKELLGAAYRPSDSLNSANDETDDLAQYLARNAKSNLQKQIEQ